MEMGSAFSLGGLGEPGGLTARSSHSEREVGDEADNHL